MQKLLFHSFLFTLCASLCLSACQQTHAYSSETSELSQELIVEPTQPSDPTLWDVSSTDISQLAPDKKYVAFSFDDAPGKTLENILAVFADFNENNPDCVATATLFCNGRLINATSSHVLSMATLLGWELGNHTYSHCDLALLPDERLPEEITTVDEQLCAVDGKEKHLFRAPYGRITQEAKDFVGVPVLNWTIDTLDWTGIPAEEIYNEVMSKVYQGAIVLFHDGYAQTVRALKRLLPDLKKSGYQIVGISQMAKAHGCQLKNGTEYIRCRPQN
ncbi:MAG: hypothetical protein E7381_01795 [Clostridiales bacterium]|nr:hypothetical protein [Clostridiales bacterium]